MKTNEKSIKRTKKAKHLRSVTVPSCYRVSLNRGTHWWVSNGFLAFFFGRLLSDLPFVGETFRLETVVSHGAEGSECLFHVVRRRLFKGPASPTRKRGRGSAPPTRLFFFCSSVVFSSPFGSSDRIFTFLLPATFLFFSLKANRRRRTAPPGSRRPTPRMKKKNAIKPVSSNDSPPKKNDPSLSKAPIRNEENRTNKPART